MSSNDQVLTLSLDAIVYSPVTVYTRTVKQALHGFLEFELFKTRSNNYRNLWKTNNFALLHQHVCNKYLQHLDFTVCSIRCVYRAEFILGR